MTIEELLGRIWEMLAGRMDGPMHFRMIMQPTMAAILAIRAGLKDARESRPPYLWTVFSNPADRGDLLRHGWQDIRKVFLIAILLDVVYELIAFQWVYPLQAIVVAVVLAIVPYALIRGPVTRVMGRRTGRETPREASLG